MSQKYFPLGSFGGMVDTADLKSAFLGSIGSSPIASNLRLKFLCVYENGYNYFTPSDVASAITFRPFLCYFIFSRGPLGLGSSVG
jgi:hypothetical protein